MLVATRRRFAAPLAIALLVGAALALVPMAMAAQQEATLVGTVEHDTHGTILATGEGMTLYTTTHQADEVDLEIWQPLTVETQAELTVVAGISGEFGTVAAEDGLLQATFDGAALYTFTGDVEVGDTEGLGHEGWSVVTVEVETDVDVEGEFSVAPVAGGLTITSYTGTITTLEADAQAHNLVSAFATVDGQFIGYTFGAPAFVNAAFVAQFEAGLESEGLIVRAQ